MANESTRANHPSGVVDAAPRRSEERLPLAALERPARGGHIVHLVWTGATLIGDVAAIGLAFFVAYHLWAIGQQRPSRVPAITEFLPTLEVQIIALLVTFALARHYLPRRGRSHADQLGAIGKGVAFGVLLAMASSVFLKPHPFDVPPELLIYDWLLTIPLVWVSRTIIEEAIRLARRAGLDPEPVLIVGSGAGAQTIFRKFESAPALGYRVLGFVETGHEHEGEAEINPARASAPVEEAEGAVRPPVLGTVTELPWLLRVSGAREIVVADANLSHAEVLDIVTACDRARVNVKVFPDVFHLVVREVDVSELGGLPMLRVRDVNLRGWNLLVKRALDIVLSAGLLVLLSPVMLLVAALVKVTSPEGPVFFVQDRVGVDGRRFACVKFRSMHVNAEATTGPVWALPGDTRTTALGRWLRRYSVDELPQLVNVLLGDMSLVGPRPERPYFVEQFSRFIPRYEKRHQEKAGVTGWAQVNGMRGQSPIEERTLYDLFYVEHWSPAFDLKILLQTVAAVIRGRNAY